MKDVMLIEYNLGVGKYLNVDMIAIFNKNKISEYEVREIIRTPIEDERILVISKEKYENIFGPR